MAVFGCAVLVAIGGAVFTHQKSSTPTTTNSTVVHSAKPTVTNPKPVSSASIKGPVTVMGVGGSVAFGWDDRTHAGYLGRAFQTLSQKENVTYHFVNKSIEGDGPTQMSPKYPSFLTSVNPQIVVISWGMLDDLANKTPIPAFKQAIHNEISMALNRHADVIVVTPPPTGASYAHDKVTETNLVNIEMAVAESFHSKNVYVFDLYRQMEAYIANHHQTIALYEADAWHPNTAGHTLAGQILADDLMQHFVVHASNN